MLELTAWINDLTHDIHVARALLSPLHELHKDEVAAELRRDIEAMRDAVAALERLAKTRGERADRTSIWLQAQQKASMAKAELTKRKRSGDRRLNR